MKKKLFLVMIFAACVISANTQVTIAVQVPPLGVIQKGQFWNFSLMNAGNTPVNAVIELTLMSSDIPVMKAITRPLLLAKGIRQIKESDLTPINYNYLSSSFALSQNSNTAFLPVGNYIACYLVTYYQGESRIILAEDCVPVEVQPLQPPLLNTPSNGENIQTAHPQFSWIPPAPINPNDKLIYSLSVVEVFPGETAEQAIQNHLPVYSIGNVNSLFKAYPSANKSLDTGKLYAWRIVAFSNNQFVAHSEVWTFKINRKRISLLTENASYIKLRKGESPFATYKGSMRFEYINDPNDKEIFYSIKRLSDNSIVKEDKLNLKAGQNFIDIPIVREQGIHEKEMYLMQMVNSRNELYTIKFLYIKPEVTIEN